MSDNRRADPAGVRYPPVLFARSRRAVLFLSIYFYDWHVSLNCSIFVKYFIEKNESFVKLPGTHKQKGN